MANQRHVIGRTVVELDAGNLADVWDLQETTSRLLRQAPPQLEQLFDRLVGNREVIRLDQVVVNLDRLAPHSFEREFLPALVTALQQTLGDQLAQRRLEAPTPQTPSADWEVLLYFLRYGRLPWWVTETAWPVWLERWQAAMGQDTGQRRLLRLLAEQPTAQQRLIIQFSDEFRHQLVAQLRPPWREYPSLLGQARQLSQALSLAKSTPQALEQEAWRLVLQALQRTDANASFPALDWAQHWLAYLQQVDQPSPFEDASRRRELEAAVTALPRAEQGLWRAALAQAQRISARPQPPDSSTSSTSPTDRKTADSFGDRPPSEIPDPAPSDSSPEIPGEFATSAAEPSQLSEGPVRDAADNTPDGGGRFQLSQGSSPTPAPINPDTLGQVGDRTADSGQRSPASAPSPLTGDSQLSPDEEAGLYIRHAGLVLLHPFLAAYLRGIDLATGNAFQNQLAQQQAIYLLHYLATRQTHAPEYDLVLPKLLCSWPLNGAIAADIPLPEKALPEGEALLQAAIDHWGALKSTSPDGLREGFLQRDGKLTQTGERTWKLQVEQKAIDVLLSRLPWGVSMVKLPWMEILLTVEWT
ncbi:MAG: contractile injection system tape measure protein [Cyanobacteria bacterium P01_A01_bin.135]